MNLIDDTDIDIDFADRDNALKEIMHVPALLPNKDKHKTAVYFQDIPIDPFTSWASIDVDQAAELGYFKVDFLNNSIYEAVRNEDHLNGLAEQEPIWELFLEKDIVESLSQIRNHFDVVKSIVPKSIHDLAIILALIRPGKKHLLGKPRHIIDREIWHKPQDNSYFFKKSHAYAYALSIIVQLNLLVESA